MKALQEAEFIWEFKSSNLRGFYPYTQWAQLVPSEK